MREGALVLAPWTYELTPADSGTLLTITESGEVYNPIFRFISRFVIGHTGTMEGVLRALGTKHGETVTPEVHVEPRSG